MKRIVLITAGAGLVATVALAYARGANSSEVGAPDTPRPESARAQLQGAYPGGTPGPGPTLTDIATGDRLYDGWTGEDIADDIIDWMQATPDPWASSTTEYYDSAEVTAADADNFGIDPSVITYRSPTDMAVILSGSLSIPMRGSTLATPEPSPFVLLLVDLYDGAIRFRAHSDDVQELEDMLP